MSNVLTMFWFLVYHFLTKLYCDRYVLCMFLKLELPLYSVFDIGEAIVICWHKWRPLV